MNVILKKGFKLIGVHGLGLALALFCLFVFSWVIEKWGFMPYSVITGFAYVGLMYSEGWNWGRKEGRKYNDINESPVRALIASIIPSIICVVLAAFIYFGFQKDIVGVIAKVWYFPFIAFYSEQQAITGTEVLLTGLVIPVVVPFGYFTGMKNFSVLEKIAFRKNRINKAKKQEEMKNKK